VSVSPALAHATDVEGLPLTLIGVLLGHLAAVGRAAALALAGVLGLAAVVAGLAAALALARIFAFTGMLFFHRGVSLLVRILCGGRSLRARKQIGSLNSGAGSREQARDRRTSDKELIRLCHFSLRPPVILNLLLPFRRIARREDQEFEQGTLLRSWFVPELSAAAHRLPIACYFRVASELDGSQNQKIHSFAEPSSAWSTEKLRSILSAIVPEQNSPPNTSRPRGPATARTYSLPG